MLELKNISKIYETAGLTQKALDGVNLSFRQNEFVSILGQSGSGKTTLLNIIGGLDQYTSGDLIINGRSTKEFKDRDWDSYRNNSVGFVFQSYNLIPHQTALANVELALTLSGVPRQERRRRSLEALKKVGLEDHVNKRPGQMSGGQMQRIAIARALVNDPDILLADEPTGALDSETSLQIMELLKEIAHDRLVVMVTHNPDLAQMYSTRIVNLLDGRVVGDSNPFDPSLSNEESGEFNPKRTSMSYLTALSLSLNNLMTKKGRTILTAFAGSIGIIGIALILSLSTGVQSYINKVQEDTLTSYPLTINESTNNISALLESIGAKKETHEEGYIYANEMLSHMLSSNIEHNDLAAFKTYLEEHPEEFKEDTNSIQYAYNLNLNLYQNDTTDGAVQVNPSPVGQKLGMNTSSNLPIGPRSSSFYSTDVWEELMDNQELLNSQYDVLIGHMPSAYNEVVLIADSNSEINDYALYSLGLKSQKELDDLIKEASGDKAQTDSSTSSSDEGAPLRYALNDLMSLKYKLVLNSDYFVKEGDIWVDKSDDADFMKKLVDDSETISVVGVIKPKPETQGLSTSGGIGYTKDLSSHVIEKVQASLVAKDQVANPTRNIFTNRDFVASDSKQTFSMNDLSQEEKMALAAMTPEQLTEYVNRFNENINATYDDNLARIGVVDLANPSSVKLYPKSFVAKDTLKTQIEAYSQKARDAGKEDLVLNYTDEVGLIMSSVTAIVDMITYVLIAFVAISLVVSSIMIGIITYISVLERTKEIGILRAIGASKGDISRVFNAETLIEGFAAGLLGIVITLLLNIPINYIVENLTGVAGITSLPWQAGGILILISMVLTLIAGIIPSRIAAKKDPVESLRME
ncbi:ABC transporter ATP-binding protein/permease [Granulicatella seriolae]|uniref:ABC transporter ATP-binding protein/permease n=1 Tax=Granulicatella seriolae TaxID=2967226 RepID=A0ABT1WLJ5_9LACT|nr:ABC transporter ATP-binding protein/permease [Granulicatella seriolae]